MTRPRRVVIERTYALSLDAAWDMLSNTEHINRSIGLPSISYGGAVSAADGFYRPAATKLFGFYELRWREYPFSWVRNEHHTVVRAFEGGPLRSVSAAVELSPADEATRVRFVGEVVPRNLLGYLLAPLVARRTARAVLRYCDEYVRLASAGAPDPLPRSLTRSPVAHEVLDRLLRRLAEMPVDAALVPRLRQRLAEGTDEEVLRMRPFALADAWRADRFEVLRLFLYATKIGLLNLSWDLICPNCRVATEEHASMADLRGQAHCDLCGVDYEAEFDRYVELRFAVNPAVRQAEEAIYCIGGPVNTPHILVQQYLEPGAERTLAVDLGDDEMRARILRDNATARLARSADAADDLALTYTQGGWLPASASYRGPRLRVRFGNETAQPVVAVLERVQWDDQAVTAAQVTAFQEFRDLFASEVLAPGQEIGIQSIAVMFTDLKGSTSLYETLGDAPAYGNVRKHFGFLVEAINRNHGALVKTIGDAVMAVFNTATDAVRAGMEVQTRVAAFNRAASIDPPLVIKLGVHYGAAIAINANERLDYFGRTVNIAARVQHESSGGDVVMTEGLFREPEIQRVLQDFGYEAWPLRAMLRGIEGEMALQRIVPR
ncbi:MAG: adenylate/guanylate cyclase domain-containing protein [Chloroflexi bacterium]|nr:adenylate/guanylate cyclase domain-containing protein [Chloroflexota bacterium]